MKPNDQVHYEADVFIVEKVNHGFALIHRKRTAPNDVRVIRTQDFQLNNGIWAELPEVEQVRQSGRA